MVERVEMEVRVSQQGSGEMHEGKGEGGSLGSIPRWWCLVGWGAQQAEQVSVEEHQLL